MTTAISLLIIGLVVIGTIAVILIIFYGENIMSALDDLKAEVARVKDVDASAVALLQGLSAKLDAALAANDPAAIQALADELRGDTDGLAASITANTKPDTPAT